MGPHDPLRYKQQTNRDITCNFHRVSECSVSTGPIQHGTDMGILGLWDAISEAAVRQSLVSVAGSRNGGLRIAIDISIWAFQCAGSAGGDNPTLRTFYYRLCRLSNAGVAAVFVFDGPRRPAFKRGKKTTAHAHSMAAFKALIRLFGFAVWLAPGEAEAECAHLQARGIVDGVLTDDVDALMFGATTVFKHWAAVDDKNKKSAKVVTHTLCYTAEAVSEKSKLSAKDMVLIALLAGGDYIPAGVPHCGIKTALEIGRAGYADSLLKSLNSLESWRSNLQESLNTNSKKEFARRHTALKIPDNFPDLEILHNYTHPIVTGQNEMISRAEQLEWYGEIDFAGLRRFGMEYFDWQGRPGDLKLIRTLAQPIFTQNLRRQNMKNSMEQRETNAELAKASMSTETVASPSYCFTIHGERKHPSTDHTPELRISFDPLDVVPLDLQEESVQDANVAGAGSRETLLDLPENIPSSPLESSIQSSSPDAVGVPSLFDVNVPMRVWIPREYLVAVYPSIVRNWELSRVAKLTKSPKKAKGSVARNGTLDRFVRVTKYLPLRKAVAPAKELQTSDSGSTREKTPTDVAPRAIEQPSPRKTRSMQNRCTAARPVVEVIDLDTDTEGATPSRLDEAAATAEPVVEERIIRRKTRIVVRKSLPGAWREALPDEAAHDCSQIIDLS